MTLLLGCIADDFTGATDLANMLVRGGLRTVQTIGVPKRADVAADAEAIVVALKSRTIPAREAVAQSLDALAWLKARNVRQLYFKYCSTFDSTPAGNIGPVADALLDALGARLTIACPAFPENRRTIYQGYLYVGETLLSESPMRDHPLTPMRDANLVRVLGQQTKRPVGLVPWSVVKRGPNAIRAELARLEEAGTAYAIVDAIDDDDLLDIGAACSTLKLVTGGSGIALGLPQNFRDAGLVAAREDAAQWPSVVGKAAVLSGSCSAATQAQVATFARDHVAVALDPLAFATPEAMAKQGLEAAARELESGRPFLVYSTAAPREVANVQAKLGRDRAAQAIETAFGILARELVARGVRRLVVAGGETSGAVVQALDIEALAIGPQIDPGVPWTMALGREPLALALKSGNFGAEDFFAKALAMLPTSAA
jgi:3-dehydrotetronate 4-kinase